MSGPTPVIDLAVTPLLGGDVVQLNLKTVHGWAEYHLIRTDAEALGEVLAQTVKRAREADHA